MHQGHCKCWSDLRRLFGRVHGHHVFRHVQDRERQPAPNRRQL